MHHLTKFLVEFYFFREIKNLEKSTSQIVQTKIARFKKAWLYIKLV